MNTDHTSHPSYRRVVRELQNYLYTIAQTDPEVTRVNPDGIYGPETAEAVRGFQQKHQLPATGRVDFETWQKLLSEYRMASRKLAEPERISPFLTQLKNGELTVGDRSDLVILVRVMLHSLGIEYEAFAAFPITDLFDEEMAEALRYFQLAQGVEPTGSVNRQTWDRLAGSYNKYIRYTQ